jgi:hypothetical protein
VFTVAVDDLVVWLRAQLDEDEQIALAASGSESGSTPAGEHWRWEDEKTDKPVTPQPGIDEYLTGEDSAPVGLRSLEAYPSDWCPRGLFHLVVCDQGEIRTVDAMHIARHDPASVLADVAAKRSILAAYDQARSIYRDRYRLGVGTARDCATTEAFATVIGLLAVAYTERPGYREEWRPAA